MTRSSSEHQANRLSAPKWLAKAYFLKKSLATTIIIGATLYSLIGFIILPVAFTMLTPFVIPEEIGYSVSIGNTSFNPYTLGLNIYDLTISPNSTNKVDQDLPLLTIDILHLDLDLASLSKRTLLAREMTVKGLFSNFIRQPKSSQNLANLLSYLRQPSGQLPYSVQNITVQDSEFIFEDTASGLYQHAENIHLTLPGLTNLPDQTENISSNEPLATSFSATLNGTPIGFNSGDSQDHDQQRKNRFVLDFEDINIQTALNYLPHFAQIKVDKGQMDVKLEIILPETLASGKTIEIIGEGSIHNLQASDSQNRSATVGRGSFKVNSKPFTDYYQLESLTLNNLHLSSADNWQITAPEIQTTNAYWQSGRIDLGKINGIGAKITLAPKLFTETGQSATTNRTITIQSLDLSQADILISSEANTEKTSLRFNNTEINGSHLTSNPYNPGEIMVSATMAEGGQIDLQGALTIFPLTAKLQYQTEELHFAPLKPLFSSLIQPTMEAEYINGVGQLLFPDLEISGSATIAGIKNILSRKRNFFSCSTTTLNNFKLTFEPQSIDIDELIFVKPLLTAEKTNRKRPALATFLFPAAIRESLTTRPSISANTIKLTNGLITLTDRATTPTTKLRITSLNAALSEMTNQPGNLTPFTLQGTVQLTPDPADYPPNNPSPPTQVAMKGEVALFDDHPELRSSLDIYNFDLTSLEPYLAPLLGYQLNHGRLDLAANIKLQNQHLTSRNHLIIKEFNLGTSTSGRFNTPLTVALLTDKKRNIKLDLEVSGNLSKPPFSYTAALAENIRNILTRTTSSPFSLVTSNNQRPEFLEYFVFPVGKTELDNKQAADLATLAAILKKRPLLKISIAGQADPDQDIPQSAQPLNNQTSNKILKELARDRSYAIQEQLISFGIDKKRLLLKEPNDMMEEVLLDRPETRADITPQT